MHRASAVIMDASSEGFIESLGGTDGVKHLRVMRVTCADIARVAGGEGALEEDDFDFRDTFRVVHDPDLM